MRQQIDVSLSSIPASVRCRCWRICNKLAMEAALTKSIDRNPRSKLSKWSQRSKIWKEKKTLQLRECLHDSSIFTFEKEVSRRFCDNLTLVSSFQIDLTQMLSTHVLLCKQKGLFAALIEISSILPMASLGQYHISLYLCKILCV